MNKQQDQKSDEELLELIAQADKKAFSQLMSRHLGSLVLFAMRYFPQRSDAEDIAQETFIRLWCKAPVWQDRGVSIKAWLFRVAYNQSIDQLRKQRLEYKPDCDENIVDESAFIERLMDAENNLAVQKIALDALPERQKTAIALCAIRGLSNGEAASVMGISVDALESLLARGRRKLKTLYLQTMERQNNSERELVNDIY
jgi:RNA polymerase sigma-70 factor (ECF subfamily)